MKIRVNVVGSGTDKDPFRVPLPTYVMIKGTEKYSGKKLLSVEVEVPDDECDLKTKTLDEAKIRQKYKGHRKWDKKDIVKIASSNVIS